MIIVYSLFNILLAYLGIKIYKSWFNPITLYSIVWEIAVGIHESGLIVFYELSAYTWFVIFLTQILFFLSCYCGTRVGLTFGSKGSISCEKVIDDDIFRKQLKKYIIITTIIAGIAIIVAFINTIATYGTNLIGSVTDIYAARVYENKTPDTIPYIGAFIYISLPLIGVYLKKFGFTFWALPAFALVFMNALTSGGRAGIVFAAILFVSAYFITGMNVKKGRSRLTKKKKILLVVGIAILVAMLVIISIQRTAGQSLKYATNSFTSIFGQNVLVYKIFTYLSGPVGVLNEYLKDSEFNFGQNTFLTIYNFLNRLGIMPRVEQYQEWFYTPLRCNVGTWIRELIEDFTIVGASIAVPVFGYATSRSYVNARYKEGVTGKVMWAILSLILLLTFFDWKLRSSNMWIALIFGYIICHVIDKRSYVSCENRITNQIEEGSLDNG